MSAPIFATVGGILAGAVAAHDLIALGPLDDRRVNAEFYDTHGRLLALVGPFSDEQIARYKLADYAMVPREQLTTTEAGWLLRVDPSRVRQLCGDGTITGTVRGRDWAVAAASVLGYRRTRRPVGRPRTPAP